MDTRFDSLSHAKTRLLFHVVFATKYRRPCLSGIEHILCECLGEIESFSDFEIISASVDAGDHLHMCIRLCKPDVSVGSVVRRIKQITTRCLWDDAVSRQQLSCFYHGRKRKLWSSGYFAATAGNDVDMVCDYIHNQGVCWR